MHANSSISWEPRVIVCGDAELQQADDLALFGGLRVWQYLTQKQM